MAPPIALTLLPTCAAAAGCGTSLLVPIPRAPTAKPNASSRPPCANGLTPGPTITPSNAPTRFPPGSTPTTIIAFIAASAIALLSLAFPRTTCCNPTVRLLAHLATQRIVHHNRPSIRDRSHKMRRLRRHDRDASRPRDFRLPADSHLELTFDYVPDFLVRVRVFVDRRACLEDAVPES